MARLKLKDRIYTRKTGHAMTAPTTILLAGGGVALGLAASLPLVAVAGIGAALWAAKVAIAMPRGIDNDGVDPFSLTEPWRSYVWKAKRSKRQFFAAVKATKKGPLHDRLESIADRVDTGVGEVYRIAQSGQALTVARAQIDEQAIRAELTQLTWSNGGNGRPPEPGSSKAAAAEALESQLATAGRLDQVIADTSDQLTLLDARLEESVTRAIELSARGHRTDELGSVVSDVDSVVGDMEALREALDETDRTSSSQLPAPNLNPRPGITPSSTSSTAPSVPAAPAAPALPPADAAPLPTTDPAPSPQATPAPNPSPESQQRPA